MKTFIFVLILCLLQVINICAQTGSSGTVSVHINNKPKTKINQNKPAEIDVVNAIVQPVSGLELPIGGSKFYSLIIGISNYIDPLISELDKPIKVSELFYNTITTRYAFEKENVKLLRNATMADIVNALDYFAKAIRPIDNFLIFYSGHGVWNAASEIGSWLHSDVQQNSKLNWFRNSAFRDYLREINSKHTLLITDACFRGSIFKTRSAFMDVPLAIKNLYDFPSWKAMISGTLTEVPDQSAFLRSMIDRLDTNSEKYLSSEQLFSSFRIAVINNCNAIPQLVEIKDVEDEGGDFIFILREKTNLFLSKMTDKLNYNEK